jgi:hypothetical protein
VHRSSPCDWYALLVLHPKQVCTHSRRFDFLLHHILLLVADVGDADGADNTTSLDAGASAEGGKPTTPAAPSRTVTPAPAAAPSRAITPAPAPAAGAPTDGDKTADSTEGAEANPDRDTTTHPPSGDSAAAAEAAPDTVNSDTSSSTDTSAHGIGDLEPVGKVFLFDLFRVPAGKRKVGKWTMRVIEPSDSLSPLPYPLADAPRIPDPDNPENTIPARAGLAPWPAIKVG